MLHFCVCLITLIQIVGYLAFQIYSESVSCTNLAACCRKEWVDVKGEYTDKGYVDKAQGVTGLPFLVAVVLGVFGALAYVVSQTGSIPSPPVG